MIKSVTLYIVFNTDGEATVTLRENGKIVKNYTNLKRSVIAGGGGSVESSTTYHFVREDK